MSVGVERAEGHEGEAPVTTSEPVAGTGPAAPEETASSRSEQRLPASQFPSITGLRLSPYGAEAHLINLSKTGVLARCDIRLTPGTPVTVTFEGTFSPSSIQARVVRSHVAEIGAGGRLSFEIAMAFLRPIALDGEAPAEPPARPAAPPARPAARRLQNRW